MLKAVIGVFTDETAAGHVVHDLREAGFDPRSISLIAPAARPHSAGTHTGHLTHAAQEAMTPQDAPSPADRTVASYTAIGALAGGLAGLAVLAIPGVGALLIAGPLMAVITGVAAGGYIGTLTGALIHFDVPEDVARTLESHVAEGKILIAVHTDDIDRRFEAEKIFDRHGAAEIDTKAA